MAQRGECVRDAFWFYLLHFAAEWKAEIAVFAGYKLTRRIKDVIKTKDSKRWWCVIASNLKTVDGGREESLDLAADGGVLI